jgi:hypothetical protein
MPELLTPFAVETSFRLPGLGLLVLPVAPEPGWLAAYDLHTALSITVSSNTQIALPILGTVEEIVHDSQVRRALLLDFDPSISLPVGTCLQASETQSELL